MTDTATHPPTTRLSATEFRKLMTCWCTGVAVVTSAADGEPVGCTVSAITSVSVQPPLLLVGLAAGSRTLAAIQHQHRLGMNLLPAQHLELARRFSRGDPANRFAGVDFRWAEGVPVLADMVVAAVCVTERFLLVADHVLVVAEPVWWRRTSHRRPLICYDRAYWSLWSMAVVGRS
ncbi:MAG: flavin reductase [Micromonosporaceae bacterium]|nr:flavin reductase [Micromonosporaceae bacterium]